MDWKDWSFVDHRMVKKELVSLRKVGEGKVMLRNNREGNGEVSRWPLKEKKMDGSKMARTGGLRIAERGFYPSGWHGRNL